MRESLGLQLLPQHIRIPWRLGTLNFPLVTSEMRQRKKHNAVRVWSRCQTEIPAANDDSWAPWHNNVGVCYATLLVRKWL